MALFATKGVEKIQQIFDTFGVCAFIGFDHSENTAMLFGKCMSRGSRNAEFSVIRTASNIRAFHYFQRIIHRNSQMANGTFQPMDFRT